MASSTTNQQPNNSNEIDNNGTETTTKEEAKEETANNNNGHHHQQQQQRKRPSILITGFGPFQDIPINPTTIIVNEIRDYLSLSKDEWKQNLLLHITDCIVMDTSVPSVCKTLDCYYGGEQNEGGEENDKSTTATTEDDNLSGSVVDIILHLGVHYKAKGFHIEQYAYNDATFRVPDESGYQPSGELIFESKQFGESFKTQIQVEELVANQTSKFGSNDVITNLSDDPGRFVCNYTYCYSLYHLLEEKKSNEGGESNNKNKNNKQQVCLFLHVPKFEVVSKEMQLDYVSTLIQKLIELHTNNTSSNNND